jgi:hypothetical protein
MESFGKSSGPGDGETVGKHGTHGRDMLTVFVISVSSETRESLDDGERSSVERTKTSTISNRLPSFFQVLFYIVPSLMFCPSPKHIELGRQRKEQLASLSGLQGTTKSTRKEQQHYPGLVPSFHTTELW